MNMLKDYASIIRSKNAGPFYITLEVFFKNAEGYHHVVDGGYLTKEKLAMMYKVKEEDLQLYYCENVNAVKLTYPRTFYAGSPMDSDVFGAQQHAPLMNLAID